MIHQSRCVGCTIEHQTVWFPGRSGDMLEVVCYAYMEATAVAVGKDMDIVIHVVEKLFID